MKFVRFISASHADGVYGIVNDGKIEVLRGGLLDTVERTGEVINESDITRYLPPIDAPNVLAVGRNYREHAAETDDDLPTKPLLFIMATTALAGHNDKIVLPAVAPDQVDYEAELVAIIGKKARNVSVNDALDYILGYSCGNDISARDCQGSDGQWARGKSFDTFAPMGPYVVSDIDPCNLRIQMRLNGETVQNQPTADMVFDVAYLISYLSHSMTLLPGTVLFSGTPSGVGIGHKPPIFLRSGDVCEVEIDGLGILRNEVVAE